MAILRNDAKQPLFTVEERMEMLREVVQAYANVEVGSFDGLLVDYAAARGANLIPARHPRHFGLRVRTADGVDEPAAAAGVETVFLMAGEAYSFISSRLVKEVASLGGDVAGWCRRWSVEARSAASRADARATRRLRRT